MNLSNPIPGDVPLSANLNAWKAGFDRMGSLGVGVRNNVLRQLVDDEVTTNQNGAWKWWGWGVKLISDQFHCPCFPGNAGMLAQWADSRSVWALRSSLTIKLQLLCSVSQRGALNKLQQPFEVRKKTIPVSVIKLNPCPKHLNLTFNRLSRLNPILSTESKDADELYSISHSSAYTVHRLHLYKSC